MVSFNERLNFIFLCLFARWQSDNNKLSLAQHPVGWCNKEDRFISMTLVGDWSKVVSSVVGSWWDRNRCVVIVGARWWWDVIGRTGWKIKVGGGRERSVGGFLIELDANLFRLDGPFSLAFPRRERERKATYCQLDAYRFPVIPSISWWLRLILPA